MPDIITPLYELITVATTAEVDLLRTTLGPRTLVAGGRRMLNRNDCLLDTPALNLGQTLIFTTYFGNQSYTFSAAVAVGLSLSSAMFLLFSNLASDSTNSKQIANMQLFDDGGLTGSGRQKMMGFYFQQDLTVSQLFAVTYKFGNANGSTKLTRRLTTLEMAG